MGEGSQRARAPATYFTNTPAAATGMGRSDGSLAAPPQNPPLGARLESDIADLGARGAEAAGAVLAGGSALAHEAAGMVQRVAGLTAVQMQLLTAAIVALCVSCCVYGCCRYLLGTPTARDGRARSRRQMQRLPLEDYDDEEDY